MINTTFSFLGSLKQTFIQHEAKDAADNEPTDGLSVYRKVRLGYLTQGTWLCPLNPDRTHPVMKSRLV